MPCLRPGNNCPCFRRASAEAFYNQSGGPCAYRKPANRGSSRRTEGETARWKFETSPALTYFLGALVNSRDSSGLFGCLSFVSDAHVKKREQTERWQSNAKPCR